MAHLSASSYFRGHPVYWDHTAWRYLDDDAPLPRWGGLVRPCAACGRVFENKPDPCLGDLPGVEHACCGHGVPGKAYLRFSNGVVVRGFDTVEAAMSPAEPCEHD